MKLTEYIQEWIALLPEDTRLIEELFEYRELSKGDNALNKTSYTRKVLFIEEGMMRMYYVKDGKDVTHLFFTENMFYMHIENLFQSTDYPYCLELLENCKIRMVEYENLKNFVIAYNKLQPLFFGLLIDYIKLLSNRLASIQFLSAQERYLLMMNSYRNILLRAPLGHIASYLGITQQTLSVIRGNYSGTIAQ